MAKKFFKFNDSCSSYEVHKLCRDAQYCYDVYCLMAAHLVEYGLAIPTEAAFKKDVKQEILEVNGLIYDKACMTFSEKRQRKAMIKYYVVELEKDIASLKKAREIMQNAWDAHFGKLNIE